ncbi:unnamed protein product [Boreogadus saida]
MYRDGREGLVLKRTLKTTGSSGTKHECVRTLSYDRLFRPTQNHHITSPRSFFLWSLHHPVDPQLLLVPLGGRGDGVGGTGGGDRSVSGTSQRSALLKSLLQ